MSRGQSQAHLGWQLPIGASLWAGPQIAIPSRAAVNTCPSAVGPKLVQSNSNQREQHGTSEKRARSRVSVACAYYGNQTSARGNEAQRVLRFPLRQSRPSREVPLPGE